MSFIDNPEKLPKARVVHTVRSERPGFISKLDARVVGQTSVEMGAGRAKKEDRIDHSVGILVHKKVGEPVETGESLFTLHATNESEAISAESRLREAVIIEDSPCEPLPLFYDRIE